jgi:hypothetical protein
MGTKAFKTTGCCRVLEFLGMAGLVLASVAWAAACKSPAASEKPETIITYTYGLIDNFESKSIDSNKWYSVTPKGIFIKQDGTGNNYVEIRDNALRVVESGTIYPDIFDKLSARLMIPSDTEFGLHAPELEYRVGLYGRTLNFGVRSGIRQDNSGKAFFFGDWRDNESGNRWQIVGPPAQLDRWHTVELEIVKSGAGDLHILYGADGQSFGDTVPTDGPNLLDRTKIAYTWRRLSIAGDESLGDLKQAVFGCFDDVWGIKVGVSKIRAASRWDAMPSPLEFLGPPSTPVGIERFPGLNRTDGRAPDAAPAREKQ